MRRRDVLRLLGLSALAPAAGRLGSAGSFVPLSARPARGQTADVELVLTAAPDEVSLLPGAATRVWRFQGRVVRGPADTLRQVDDSYLGPTIRLTRGQRVRVRFENRLGEPSIVHWHGLNVPQDADGHPRLVVGAGRDYEYDFIVANRAGTYWYHPHPHMRTGPQVHMGLAGLLIVEDEEEAALGLPRAPSELTCVIQDREFDDGNQFVYPLMDPAPMGGGMGRGMGAGRGRGMAMARGGQGRGMAAMMAMELGVTGDRVLVNGRPGYRAEVEAGWVRLRLLNGSNARVYKLAWTDGRPMTVIGTDGGLLERAAERRALALGPAQRVDVLVDFSDLQDGATARLVTLEFPVDDAGHGDMMMGMMGGAAGGAPQGAPMDVMTLAVRGRNARPVRLPDRLSVPGDAWAARPDAPVRRVPLSFERMQWMLDGRVFDMTDVADSEIVRAGSTHVWEFENTTNPMGMEMAHPIHLHGRQFRVLGRSGGAPGNALREGLVDAGWTDTVLVLPGETVRAQITFSEHPGLFLYHCHNLEHEDAGMMRNFRIEN